MLRNTKCYWLFFFYLCLNKCYSFEPEYNRETMFDYLTSSEHVYEVIKVGGALNYFEYKKYLNGYVDDFGLSELWRDLKFVDYEVFLVLRVLRGNKRVGELIKMTPRIATFGADRGFKYMIFSRGR